MQEIDDSELVRRYVEEQSEAAFEALVMRHVNLVYSAARRSTNNGHQAEEITQAVFIILARKARGLRPDTILSSWLYQTSRLTAANHLRTEIRRARREQEAHMQSLLNETDPDPWPQIAPLLEHAVGCLNEKDRNAIVLRFFEKKSLGEIGRVFGTSEDAAKMRVNRALEKLRRFFAKRGLTLSVAVLAAAVSAHSVQAAPLGLATTVAATITKGSTVAVPISSLVEESLKLLAWTKARRVATLCAAASLLGVSATFGFKQWEVYELHRDSWRTANLDSGGVERAMPQVRIVPTKFDQTTHVLAQTPSNDRWGGIRVSVGELVCAAYDWRPARIIFPDGPPEERYDFIANLPQGSPAALQKELEKTLGYVGRRESKEVDILLLRVKRPAAPGLMPPNPGGGDDWSVAGRYYCDDRALSSPHPPHLGLTRFLEGFYEKPIIDRTGLTQHFRIDLRWPARHRRPFEVLELAMLDQLGLELVPGRESVEMLVVERVGK